MKKKLIMRFAAVMMIVTVLMSCSWAVYASSESSSSTASASSQVPTTGNSTDKEKKNPVTTILISLGAGLAVSGIAVFIVASGYKNNGKSEPYPYNKKAPLDLRVRTDNLIDTEIEKKKIEKNNNNN